MPEQNEVFASLYRAHASFAYGIAFAYLRNAQEAEDVVSEVFLQLMESGTTFPDEMRTRAWLAKAVRNRCNNLRKHWLRKKRADNELLEALPAADRSPELHAVMEALLRLPERYRLPLLLFAVQGYSVRETAEILHMNESTVRTRIARAREMIRKETGVESA